MKDEAAKVFDVWVVAIEGRAREIVDLLGDDSPLFRPLFFDEQLQKGYPHENWNPKEKLLYFASMALMSLDSLKQSESHGERLAWALALGNWTGLMDGATEMVPLWLRYREATKSGRAAGSRKRSGAAKRTNILTRYIIENGAPPEKGDFGKTNPDRTKYFQKFKRESGLSIGVDTFNRYLESITEDDLNYAKRCIREAAAARFIGTHYPRLRKDTKTERIKLYRQFKRETGHKVASEQFLRWVDYEKDYPGMMLRDLESRVVPY